MAKDDDHGVEGLAGYGRPPKEHRVKPGETRNPWGRKGRPRLRTDFMDELIEICIDGKYRKATRGEALDYGLFQEAVKGNVSAAREVERRRKERASVSADATASALHSEEQAALDRYVQRRLQEGQARATTTTPDKGAERLKAAAREITSGWKK